MNAVFYTSDTHFGHAMVAAKRGFENPEAHDEELVRRWNEVVRPADVVWHLGDVSMGKRPAALQPVLARLNGTLHLVAGNHDRCWPGHRDSHKEQRAWLDLFSSVQPFAKRRVGDRLVLLSHFPYSGDHTAQDRFSQFRLRDEGAWLLHGHTHSHEILGDHPRQIHVGADAHDLAPVDEGAITRLMAYLQ